MQNLILKKLYFINCTDLNKLLCCNCCSIGFNYFSNNPIFFARFTCSMMYYGLSLNTGALSGSIYTNTLISGAVEIPSLIICIFLLNWKLCGRRLTSSGTFLVAGLSSIITIPLILYGELNQVLHDMEIQTTDVLSRRHQDAH